ncbi:glutathione S-transferase [Shimia sp.]|uniref:glutathione S-transferase n=1 Tax=Shimia sp. TaxID=1954381 RepID=UPI00329752F8
MSIYGKMKMGFCAMADAVLYSFRRCPYAIRARLAVAVAGVDVELREILLRDKAPAFLATSPSGTVPCLETAAGVLDESLDIMIWALRQNDPDGWLDMPEAGYELIDEADGPFKRALDRTKYHTRYIGADPEVQRSLAMSFLNTLENQLAAHPWLFGDAPRLADMAILPFVRQFAFIDKPRFDAEAGPGTQRWLNEFLMSDLFRKTMLKLPVWAEGDPMTRLDGEIRLPQDAGRTTSAPH